METSLDIAAVIAVGCFLICMFAAWRTIDRSEQRDRLNNAEAVRFAVFLAGALWSMLGACVLALL